MLQVIQSFEGNKLYTIYNQLDVQEIIIFLGKCLSQQIRGGFSLPSLAFSVTFPRNDERIMNYSLYSFTDVFWLNEEYIGRGCIDGSIVLWGRWVNELKGVNKLECFSATHCNNDYFSRYISLARLTSSTRRACSLIKMY